MPDAIFKRSEAVFERSISSVSRSGESKLPVPRFMRPLYPVGMSRMVGPVGECHLDACALDRVAAAELWAVSERKTGLNWPL